MSGLLQDRVTRQAESRPHATAVVSGAERLSYAQLDAASNRLARTLREAGVGKGDRVCFLMPKSPAALVCMLGILKAGAIHVPLDAASPAARIRKILAACEARSLLAAGRVAPLLEGLFADAGAQSSLSLGWLEDTAPETGNARPAFLLGDIERASSAGIEPGTCAGDPAHILFTSGSTGVPKGVVITHANVASFVQWGISHFGIGHGDRLSGHTPLHFDLSTFDVFGTYAAGAELHLVPREVALLPAKLAQFIRNSGLTQWFSVPSVLQYMAKADALRHGDFPQLRRVLWCGEVLPTPALVYWMQRLPHVRFTNLYGPTEATIASSYHDVAACPVQDNAPIPIGVPCAGEELLVLDERLEPVPDDTVGDLYIRGVGLSPGYWRDPDKTAAAFLPNPRLPGDRLYKTGDLGRRDGDGLFHFAGRSDTQIKSRGYRIELGEIEAALNALPGLRECAVVAIASEGFEGWLICCAYAPDPQCGVAAQSLRTGLARLLPAYMLPARWMGYETLPKNANDKIDRALLKNAFSEAESASDRLHPQDFTNPLAARERRYG